MTDERTPLWIPTPEEVAIIRQILEDNETTIKQLRAALAAAQAQVEEANGQLATKQMQLDYAWSVVRNLQGTGFVHKPARTDIDTEATDDW